jgi:hypothetical protein
MNPTDDTKPHLDEVAELRRENERLREELEELQILLDNTIAHGEAVEDQLSDSNLELGKEKKKTDDLLLNILPLETADELKRWGVSPARSYESVTVMFTDFKGFTKISEQLTPQRWYRNSISAFEPLTTSSRATKSRRSRRSETAISAWVECPRQTRRMHATLWPPRWRCKST